MHFSFKNRISRQAPALGVLGITAAASLLLLLSGCTGQQAAVDQSKSSLVNGPVMDQKLVEEDFAFPSQLPSLARGREIYFDAKSPNSCIRCHAQAFWQTPKVKQDLAFSTPIDYYLMLTTGQSKPVLLPTEQRRSLAVANHPVFRETLNQDDRWAVIFYTRYLAGAGDMKSSDPKTDIAAIFGGNCAVCHGKNGNADGYLYTSKTGNHELHDGAQVHNFMPPPANFRQYNRVYNRTDAQLFKYVCEGIYPSAMPAWYGDVNVDKDTGKVTYAFDEKMIFNLIRHVRSLGYNNDLKGDLPEAITPPPGLAYPQPCQPVPTNRPWTNAMKNDGPQKGSTYVTPAADPITGGMTHVEAMEVPVVPANKGASPSPMEERKAE